MNVGLISQRKGLPCRAGDCDAVFLPGVVPSSGSHSQGIRRREDAQVRELLATAELRNDHERTAHDYHHGACLVPKPIPFSDNDGHANKTLRWDLAPTR